MGNSVEINEDIHPRRYFRSGVEMERMADVYLAEGSLENAYVLYTKFIMWDLTTHPKHHVQASSEALTVAKVTATLEGHFYIKKRPQWAKLNCTCCVFSLFVEKLPHHRDYQQCTAPERRLIIKVTSSWDIVVRETREQRLEERERKADMQPGTNRVRENQTFVTLSTVSRCSWKALIWQLEERDRSKVAPGLKAFRHE